MRVALLLVAALAGCAGLGGHCGPADQLQFIEPALYAKLDAAPEAPTRGVPLEPAPWPDARVVGVQWFAERPGREGVSAEWREGTVYVHAPPDAPAERVRAAFRALAANVSAADEPTQRAWEDALLASREPTGFGPGGAEHVIQVTYRVDVDGPYRFADHVAALGGWEAADEVWGYPGARYQRWDNTTGYELALPAKTQRIGDVQLAADASGLASASRARDEAAPREESIAAFRDALAQLGIAMPAVRDDNLVTSIC